MLRTFFYSCLASFCLVLPNSPAFAIDHTKDSVEDIKKNLVENKAVLLDVREQAEWDEGHLKQAHLLPLSELKKGADPKIKLKELKKETIIYCHCRAGRRALEAGELLKKMGYDVRPLKPGFEELNKAGLEKAEKK